MLRILLADDDPVFLSRMEHLLMQYAAQRQLNIQIGAYTRDDMSGFILQPYDIAFLDIDFGNRRGAGIDLARRLRQKRNDAIIIFVTSYVEYAPEGYELRAFRYLLKTDVDASWKPISHRRWSILQPSARSFPFRITARSSIWQSMIFFTLNLKNTRYISICSAEILTSTAAIHPCRALKKNSSRLVFCVSRKAIW